jgi:steroid delta-isomerase-like uncharacterized protein
MKEEEIRKIYEDYYRAINAKPFDLEKVISFFADDVYYEDPQLGYICRNKEEVRTFFKKCWTIWPEHIMAMTWFVASENRLACEFVWTMVQTGTKIKGMNIQELNNEGKIKWDRDYYDVSQITRQLGISIDDFFADVNLKLK